jgi:hypothetical protein
VMMVGSAGAVHGSLPVHAARHSSCAVVFCGRGFRTLLRLQPARQQQQAANVSSAQAASSGTVTMGGSAMGCW